MVVGVWGWQPSEFWALHPIEFYWLMEAKRPTKMYGSMTEAEVAEIYDEAYGNEAEEA